MLLHQGGLETAFHIIQAVRFRALSHSRCIQFPPGFRVHIAQNPPRSLKNIFPPLAQTKWIFLFSQPAAAERNLFGDTAKMNG
jgi:hypothetical protein